MELINKYIARGTKKSEEATKAVPLSTVEKTQENKIRKKQQENKLRSSVAAHSALSEMM